MKSSHIFGLTVLILMAVAVLLIATGFSQPQVSARQLDAAALSAQVTSTPTAGDNSVIGSTDGIVALGILIVLVIFIPLIFRNRSK